MTARSHHGWIAVAMASTALVLASALPLPSSAAPLGIGQRISIDPFSGDDAQHHTQAEVDTFSVGSKIVVTFQSGRFPTGCCATAIGFATSLDGGDTWTSGHLPDLTVKTGGKNWERATDPTVTYDHSHAVWMIASVRARGPFGMFYPAISDYAVSTSPDGVTWSSPVVAVPSPPSPPGPSGFGPDRGMLGCDNTPASPFHGRCYLSYIDTADKKAKIVWSIDGGQSWSQPTVANGGHGQPLVQPDGTVILVSFGGDLHVARSVDGGATFTNLRIMERKNAPLENHGIRAPDIVSTDIDAGGRIWVAWQDCRFRAACALNDIVLTSSTDGVNWVPLTRVPTASLGSVATHFAPGLAVDPATSGRRASLALSYYTVEGRGCDVKVCAMRVGFISSDDGGNTWSRPMTLTPAPMAPSWVAQTDFGDKMLGFVGDYSSLSFAEGGVAVPVFSYAEAPPNPVFSQSIFATRVDVHHTCDGWHATVAAESSPLNQILTGTDAQDVIVGDVGNDEIQGLAGDDLMCGREGNDKIDGGLGKDRVAYTSASAGVRVDLTGGAAVGDGGDQLVGVEDVIGSRFDDVVTGSFDNNILWGRSGHDQMAGLDGRDTLHGELGADSLFGGEGWDFLIDGGSGNDFLAGGAGNDALLGGPGEDTVSFSRSLAGVVVDLSMGSARGEGMDSLIGIENLIGSSAFANELRGSSIANRILGGRHTDILAGQEGADTLEGGEGGDLLVGGSGSDELIGGPGLDVCRADAADTFTSCEFIL